MTTARLIEHGITRQLLRRREQHVARGSAGRSSSRHWHSTVQPWADRIIAILAVTTGLLVMGSYLEELLWALLAAATVYTLR